MPSVIFDMDGVILDTETLVQKAWGILGERHGIPDLAEAIKTCTGARREERQEMLKKYYHDPDFPAKELMAESSKIFFSLYDKKLPLKEGASECLHALKDRGVPIAVASSTRFSVVREQLAAVELYDLFDAVVCGDMVTHSKPHPEIFLTAAERLHADPADCFVIEDSYNGVRAGHAAGMRTVMVPDLLPPTPEIEALCEAVLPSLTGFIAYFEKLNQILVSG